MITLGANAAILHNNQILLTCREDFEVWCLPGGGVEDGESPAEAAIREVKEELGLDVRLLHLVGVYARPGWPMGGALVMVYAAQITGGELRPNATEVIQYGWFTAQNLPPMLAGHKQRALDALAGMVGASRCQAIDYPLPKDLNRAQIYALRDQSGLPRAEFYAKTFGHLDFVANEQQVAYTARCENENAA
ncbi:MAG: hypothetical protein OHK0052_14770 [Anaerolineales bacterium]